MALREEIQLTEATDLIRDRFKKKPAATWESVVDLEHSSRARAKEDEIEEMVREEIATLVTEEED
jgi:hypothetical protein